MTDRSKFWRVTVDRVDDKDESFIVQGPDIFDEVRVTEILMEVHQHDWNKIKKMEPIKRPEWANAFMGD